MGASTARCARCGWWKRNAFSPSDYGIRQERAPAMARLENKVALVTGAGRGIGEAIARRFHEEGASVVVNDLDQGRAEEVANAVKGRAVTADVSDSKAVAAMFETVRAQERRLDILVNNAGIAPHESNPELASDLVALAIAQVKERMRKGSARVHSD